MIVIGIDRDNIDRAVAHPAFGDHAVGKGIDCRRWPAQQNGFQRCLMVEHDMRGRGDQIVVRVLQIEQARGQFARAVVIDVAEAGHACPTVVPAAITARRIDPLADEIAHRFGSAGIGKIADDFVELRGELVVD